MSETHFSYYLFSDLFAVRVESSNGNRSSSFDALFEAACTKIREMKAN